MKPAESLRWASHLQDPFQLRFTDVTFQLLNHDPSSWWSFCEQLFASSLSGAFTPGPRAVRSSQLLYGDRLNVGTLRCSKAEQPGALTRLENGRAGILSLKVGASS